MNLAGFDRPGRGFALAAAFALGLAAQPAAAWTKGQLDCPVRQAPAGLGKAIVSVLVDSAEGEQIDQNLLVQIEAVANACAKAEKVPKDQQRDYGVYVLSVISRTEQIVQLRALGINPATIDKALDLGPGKSNRAVEDLTETDFAKLIDMLAADGIDVRELASRDLRLIGTYASITAELYRGGEIR